ncbi:Glutathione S-transferase GST-6.0 [Microbulbifer aggregans]|uniref:Glutathione S-transferase GST-6.0 n=1 Tax=Microbulbifer aggregans TaxID=1769779 RepID=A0A1C9W5A4_9GAMM|nr:glutathione transferase GstA [Microbulbifer aggregans]AOS96335.1 Glutathione S-transferase GST-6.0 [Microbulbifer aggregans]
MKLFYSPGACSLSPHIVACEVGIPVELVQVDLKNHRLVDSGGDFGEINPKGYVPVLQLEGGERLTEGPAIVQFLAEQKPDAGLLPEVGSLDRYRVQEWLNYISTELHKTFVPLFWNGSEEEKAAAKEKLSERFAYVDSQLAGDYLLGDRFTVADAYLFTVTNWMDRLGMDYSDLARLQAFQKRMKARPGVQEALHSEGLS